MTARREFSDTDLHAYLDDEVTGAERAAIEHWLSEDAEAAKRLRAYRANDQRLRGAFEGVLSEPRTAALQDAVLAMRAPGRRPWWQMAAAAVLLAASSAAAGYWSRDLLGGAQVQRPMAEAAHAIDAHTVYAPEVRHPVEVRAQEERHLVEWLSKRVGHAVRAPALAEIGYALIGGRLLPDDGRAAAQFMYEDQQGHRLTLYVRNADAPRDTAFEFVQREGVAAFYWIEKPLAYAIVGTLDRDQLLHAARLTYTQLQSLQPPATEQPGKPVDRGSR